MTEEQESLHAAIAVAGRRMEAAAARIAKLPAVDETAGVAHARLKTAYDAQAAALWAVHRSRERARSKRAECRALRSATPRRSRRRLPHPGWNASCPLWRMPRGAVAERPNPLPCGPRPRSSSSYCRTTLTPIAVPGRSAFFSREMSPESSNAPWRPGPPPAGEELSCSGEGGSRRSSGFPTRLLLGTCGDGLTSRPQTAASGLQAHRSPVAMGRARISRSQGLPAAPSSKLGSATTPLAWNFPRRASPTRRGHYRRSADLAVGCPTPTPMRLLLALEPLSTHLSADAIRSPANFGFVRAPALLSWAACRIACLKCDRLDFGV